MRNELDIPDLIKLSEEKIAFGEQLIKSLLLYEKLEGIQKLQRKIKQELLFLHKVASSGSIKKEHLQCTNLTHFSALVQQLSGLKDCIYVNKPILLGDRKVVIDVIYDNGLSWMKVIARNPKSLSQICMGNTNYGVKSILEQAEEYIEGAEKYPCMFQKPKIVFAFANGIGENLAAKLEHMGVQVDGERLSLEVDCDINISDLEEDCIPENTSQIKKVNIDVSTMLAYTSSVTNGSCNLYRFDVPVLKQQAEWESKRPIKPLLDKFFSGKTLYCCQTAKESFLDILFTVGGPKERERGMQLLERITVLPDDATAEDMPEDDTFDNVQLSQTVLPVGGKIKERSLKIFTFGDRIHAATVTSNDGFVRAAKQQGVNFVVFVHESRALTEQKETKATLISNQSAAP